MENTLGEEFISQQETYPSSFHNTQWYQNLGKNSQKSQKSQSQDEK